MSPAGRGLARCTLFRACAAVLTAKETGLAKLSLSERYAIGAALALLLVILVDRALVMLLVSVVGLALGFWVVRRGEALRVAWIALVAFAITLVIAILALLR